MILMQPVRPPRSALEATCLANRLALPLPAEYDDMRSLISFYVDDESPHWVRTVHPFYEMDHDALNTHYRTADLDANAQWEQRFGSPLPFSTSMIWAQCLQARRRFWDAQTQLSSAEWDVVENYEGDFTMSDLYLMVEGLGWRPGTPVDEHHEGWVAVWYEDIHCGGYLAAFRDILSMPEVGLDWVPPAVTALSARFGGLK
ncbi:hypothetical protein [Burkholderia cepacia]|uniref:hypothetical protein n=1 Tax=Burkholderia cepacia TaxID=292 RepID=UPI001CF5FACC|nr:hypothetical protein [Burkholderia cepacia]MCA8355572.1 hypothetical protein [Burkholderia cepacia]